MPLYRQYRKQIDCPVADLSNIGTMDRMAGSCTAAAFLKVKLIALWVLSVSVKQFLFFKDFVDIEKWSHIDIAGVMDTIGEVPYLPKGMAGTAFNRDEYYIMPHTRLLLIICRKANENFD